MLELLNFDSDIKLIVSLSATTISVCNLCYYIYSVFKMGIKPHSYTWLIWSLVTFVAAYAQYKGGGGHALILTLWVGFASLTISILGAFKGNKDITKSDKACLYGCIISILILPFSRTPLLSLLISTGADASGFYPTIRKSFAAPQNENAISFFLYGFTYSLGIISLDQYNFLTTFYPLTIVILCWFTVIFLLVRRKQLSK